MSNKNPPLRTAFGPSPDCSSTTPNQTMRKHHQLTWPRVIARRGTEPSMTKQEFMDECDINSIMSRYQRTGAINHYAKWSPSYGEFSPCDYQEAQNLVLRAQKMFAELPSSIRNLTQSPEGFLAFIQNPDNGPKLVELGLVPSPPQAEQPPPAAT